MAELKDILEAYREIQTLDHEEAELETQLNVCQKHLSELEQHRRQEEQGAVGEQAALEDLARRRRKLEQNLGDKGARIKKLKTQLMSLASAKEYEAMTRELSHLQADVDIEEAEMLDIMEQEERGAAHLAARQVGSADTHASFTKERERLETQISEKREGIASRAAERSAWFERIKDFPARQRLENLRHQHGTNYLVDVINGCCGGCRMAQTPQLQLMARLQRELVLCEGCGRVLVGNQDPKSLPEDSASAD
jgi:predicted  nucleic acid-binding Zn-ribbon protein